MKVLFLFPTVTHSVILGVECRETLDLDFDLEGGGGGIHSSDSEGVKSFMEIYVFFPFPTVIHLERELMFSILRGVSLGVSGS